MKTATNTSNNSTILSKETIEQINQMLKSESDSDYERVSQYAKELSISEDTAFKVYNFMAFLDYCELEEDEYGEYDTPTQLEATQTALKAISKGYVTIPSDIDFVEEIDSDSEFASELVNLTI
jgi:hypothetical protein